MKSVKTSRHAIHCALVACTAVAAALFVAQGLPASAPVNAVAPRDDVQSIVTAHDALAPHAPRLLRSGTAEVSASAAIL